MDVGVKEWKVQLGTNRLRCCYELGAVSFHVPFLVAIETRPRTLPHRKLGGVR